MHCFVCDVQAEAYIQKQEKGQWFQASAAEYENCDLLGIMKLIVVILYRPFGTTYRDPLRVGNELPLLAA